jgi:hypothetical protein
LTELGPVKHVVSPNYEHLKYAKQWIAAYPDATAWACPGLQELKPDIKYSNTIGDSDVAPSQWPAEIDYAWFDCETSPLSGKLLRYIQCNAI